jgi:hypothetical protein
MISTAQFRKFEMTEQTREAIDNVTPQLFEAKSEAPEQSPKQHPSRST